jgi:hypothetical protein
VRDRLTDFEDLGAIVVAVAPRAAEQAVNLRDRRGIRDVPLLLDPHHELRQRAGLASFGLSGLVSPRGALNYLRAVGRGRRPGRIHGYDLQPGVIVADRDLGVRRTWRGRTYGDYPPVGEVLAEVRILDPGPEGPPGWPRQHGEGTMRS